MCGTADKCFQWGLPWAWDGKDMVRGGLIIYYYLFCGGGADGLCARCGLWTFSGSWAVVGGAVCVPVMPWRVVGSQGLGRACPPRGQKGPHLIN